MLKKRNRLTRNDFARLLKQGRRLNAANLAVVYLKTVSVGTTNGPLCATPLAGVRCGVVVSKKTARRASARNKLRRNIYAILGGTLCNEHDLLVAVLTRPAAATLTKEALTEELASLLRRTVGSK